MLAWQADGKQAVRCCGRPSRTTHDIAHSVTAISMAPPVTEGTPCAYAGSKPKSPHLTDLDTSEISRACAGLIAVLVGLAAAVFLTRTHDRFIPAALAQTRRARPTRRAFARSSRGPATRSKPPRAWPASTVEASAPVSAQSSVRMSRAVDGGTSVCTLSRHCCSTVLTGMSITSTPSTRRQRFDPRKTRGGAVGSLESDLRRPRNPPGRKASCRSACNRIQVVPIPGG